MSLNAAAVIAVAFGLEMTIVSTEVAFGAIDAGAKDFVAVGALSTVSVAEAPATVPALVVATLPVELL